MRATSDPARRPNAIRAHTYGPPSYGNAVPSSEITRPAGTKKSALTNASQTTVCAPPRATAPSVSRTTIAAIRKQIASIRPSSRRSFECSERRRSTSAAGWDMPNETSAATGIFPRGRSGGQARRDGDAHAHTRALPPCGVDHRLTAGRADALDHRVEAGVQRCAGPVADRFRVEPAPVVGDLAQKRRSLVVERYHHLGRARMLADVGERLLDRPVRELLDVMAVAT